MHSHTLLRPTLHIEVTLRGDAQLPALGHAFRQQVIEWCRQNFASLKVGQQLDGFEVLHDSMVIDDIEVAEYIGAPNATSIYELSDVELEVQTYTLKSEKDETRDRTTHLIDSDSHHFRILPLPNILLKNDWRSLVFDHALPAHLLRCLVRMVGMMKQYDLDLSVFNWNRLCLLHGPPGSGKSTLCRALAQKLSIRLGDSFLNALLIEINTNAMLSKYFSESGKIIESTFAHICELAQDPQTFVCVVMDEIETIAGSRERLSLGSDCTDGLRATNQLLTALDRIRILPNVLVFCTSNLIGAIDPAFLNRANIKQYIPAPSPAAIYNIFRSCFNELLRSGNLIAEVSEVPTFSEMRVRLINEPEAPARRLWAIAQQCQGFSGRTLRCLPILGLAMYTNSERCSLDEGITALQAAVEQEVKAGRMEVGDVNMANV